MNDYEYDVEDLQVWADQDSARRFEISWLSTSKGGYRVKIWSNRSRTKENGRFPIVHCDSALTLDMAIRGALAQFGENVQ